MAADQRFEDMGAIVTGGASGIGLAVARRIVAEGGQAALWDVDQAKLDAATAELGKLSRGSRVDVTDPGEVERAAKEADAAMGHVDVLVCSAGVAGANALGDRLSRSTNGSGSSTSTSTASSTATDSWRE